MDFETLDSFLEAENERLLESLPGLAADNVALAQTVKLSEEVGELGHAVLEAEGLQRPRDDERPGQAIELEIADVVITAFLLAETLDVDLESAIARKMARIETRYD